MTLAHICKYLIAASILLSFEYSNAFQESNTHSKNPFYTEIQNKADIPLLSPTYKDRKISKFVLDNGLQVLLISDPNAEQSSAALMVETGSWEEPADHPGLAHFLEHMLFLGTKSYPDESEYHRYITQNGGQDNAFTMNDETAYLFSVSNNALEGALDRFASFFKEPLFNPSGVTRELNAIDQEYAKNLQNDNFRVLHVLKALSRKDHPDFRFNMGNSQSLSNTSQETLKDWFKNHYSANIMKLAVYSPLPMDKLKKMTVMAFKDIPNNNRPPFHIEGVITPEDVSGNIVYIEPFQNARELYIRWEIPARIAHMDEAHPEKIVCHIIGHEGKTSLLAQLKRENLATALSCGILPEARDSQFVYLEIELTEEGLKKYTTVIERVYQTLAMLKSEGIPQSLFEEMQKEDLLTYQFQERKPAFKEAMYHALRMPTENIETYPQRSELASKYDPQAIHALLEYLSPKNARIVVLAPYQETRIKATEKEPWLGVPYTLKPVSRTLFAKWMQAAPNPAIKLPEPNPFIPQNLSVLATSSENAQLGSVLPNRGVTTPKILLDDDHGRIYYTQDKLYLAPKVDFIFTIRTPEITPEKSRTVALAELYTKCVQDSLDDASYNAKLAGLNFSIKMADKNNGIKLIVQGFNDKAPQYFDTITHALNSPGCDESKFMRFKDMLLRSYADKYLEPPIEQSIEVLKNILYRDFATPKEKEASLKRITFDDYKEFVKNLYNSSYVEGIIYGNINNNDAQKVVQRLQESITHTPYPPAEQFHQALLMLPSNAGPYFWEESIAATGNAALLAIEAGEATYTNRAAQQILMQAVSEAFFNILRTQQQTGYLVFSGGEELEGQTLDYFAVQSNTHDGRDLLARFEQFIEDYLREIETKQITPEKYEIMKNALIQQMQQTPPDMDAMAELINELATTYFGDFDRPQKRINAFKNLEYNDFISYAKTSLGQSNKRRLGILIKGAFPEESPLRYEKIRSKGALRQEGKFITQKPSRSK